MLRHPRRRAGFTTVELLAVLAVLGVLAAVALPGFMAQIRQARRADAHVAIAQVQQAQERYRSAHATHAATLAALGLAATSPAGHYRLATGIDAPTGAHRYTVSAEAVGAQAADAACRHLRVVMDGGILTQQSGDNGSHGNDAAANRACWPA